MTEVEVEYIAEVEEESEDDNPLTYFAFTPTSSLASTASSAPILSSLLSMTGTKKREE
jgi:hypothetical protein